MEGAQIIGIILGLILSTLSGLALARSSRMEKRIDDMYDRFADLRADLPNEYVKKDEYWMDVAGAHKKLDRIDKSLADLNRREGSKDE